MKKILFTLLTITMVINGNDCSVLKNDTERILYPILKRINPKKLNFPCRFF